MKRKLIFAVIIVLAVVVGAILIMQQKNNPEGRKPAVEFSVSLKREDVMSLIEEKTKITGLEFVSGFLPEKIDISCRAELSGEGEVPIRLTRLSVNGQELPHELYEKYLDFGCSLVYN